MSLLDKITTPEELAELKALIESARQTQQKGGFVSAAELGMPVFSNKQLAEASKQRAKLEAQKGKTIEDIEAEIAQALH